MFYFFYILQALSIYFHFVDLKVFDENQIADFDYAQFGKSKTIDCCAHNVSRILWYFWNKQYPEWRLFPWEPYCSTCDNRPRLEDNNQTLLIMETGNDHAGIYRCIAMSENNNIVEHNTTIEVFCKYFVCKFYIKYNIGNPIKNKKENTIFL